MGVFYLVYLLPLLYDILISGTAESMCNKTFERKSETKWKSSKFEVQISKFLNSI